MPGGDRSQILSGVVEQAVVIQNYQRSAVLPRSEHLLRQPGQHSSRGGPGSTVVRLIGRTTDTRRPGIIIPVGTVAGGRRWTQRSTRALTASAAYRKRGEVAAAIPNPNRTTNAAPGFTPSLAAMLPFLQSPLWELSSDHKFGAAPRACRGWRWRGWRA